MFEDAGWKVVDRDFYSPTLSAAAIREGLLEGNREADYFLFINGMAAGEFGMFRLTENGDPFNTIYTVKRTICGT